MSLKPNDIIIMDSNIAIKWNNNTESFVSTKELRNMCPCANCSGESDVFGNKYKGPEIKLTPKAYKLINVIKVGNYAISITWGDLHNTGIYTFEYLRELDLNEI